MKKQTFLATAAIAGIFAGAAMKASAASTPTSPSQHAGIMDADKGKGETHDCAGKNSCKGKGGCKSGDNGCAGKNSCKGKGGCAMKDGKPAHK